MRLWHYDMLNVLPKQQLLSQLRECVAISKNIYENGTPNHILVNPIMNYNLNHFRLYCILVLDEFSRRKYNVSLQTYSKFVKYINIDKTNEINYYWIDGKLYFDGEFLFDKWHNTKYLVQCLYNIEEKYDRGGVPNAEWERIYHKYFKYIDF